jgi:hypothetical protein
VPGKDNLNKGEMRLSSARPCEFPRTFSGWGYGFCGELDLG